MSSSYFSLHSILYSFVLCLLSACPHKSVLLNLVWFSALSSAHRTILLHRTYHQGKDTHDENLGKWQINASMPISHLSPGDTSKWHCIQISLTPWFYCPLPKHIYLEFTSSGDVRLSRQHSFPIIKYWLSDIPISQEAISL